MSSRYANGNMTPAHFTPPTSEADFLLNCARVRLSASQSQHLRERLARPLDWSRLLELAAGHGLLPLLSLHVQALPAEGIPALVRDQLRLHQHAVALRNLGLVGELVRVLRLLDEHHIPALTFKGPTLAQFAYGHLALREFGDLDLLLRPCDVPRARSLLIEQGYHAQYDLNPAQETAYLRYQGQIPLEKPERAIVELHAALAPRTFLFDLDFARLWPRHCQVMLSGQAIAAPGAEDLLLILSMHGAKHMWNNLGWICDLAELLRVQPQLNWDQVYSEARRLRCERMLRLGLYLAERVLEAPLPADICVQVRRDPAVQKLADSVLRHLLDSVKWNPGGMASAAFHWRLREQWRDGLRYSLSLFLTPTLADWRALSLPPPLAFLYYGVRPLRLAGKYLRLSRSEEP